MFAQLLTEAGDLEVPRAEAIWRSGNLYHFEWQPVGRDMPEDTIVYAGLYISRRAGPCIGMAPLARPHGQVYGTSSLSMDWDIKIPMGRPRGDGDGPKKPLGLPPSNLVKRLRNAKFWDAMKLCLEAADEIERLAALVP